MRLWSLPPKYRDAKGLVALWREGLPAGKVLEGKTRGYSAHPQLERFRAQQDPRAAIDAYLYAVLAAVRGRGCRLDATKRGPVSAHPAIPVTTGRLDYERVHLLNKLKTRDLLRYHRLCRLDRPEPHPLFRAVVGPIASWERGK